MVINLRECNIQDKLDLRDSFQFCKNPLQERLELKDRIDLQDKIELTKMTR